jgi:hypothetical protein
MPRQCSFGSACLLLSSLISAAPVVDEPLGARYSLGLTLYHMGHDATRIAQFHDFLKQSKLTPGKLLPASASAHGATGVLGRHSFLGGTGAMCQ